MPTDLRNLPAAVLDRLAAHHVDGPTPGADIVTTYRGRDFRLEERRAAVEVREADGGAPIFDGYASSTGVWYPVYGGAESAWGWDEMIVAGAFGDAIDRGDDTRLLINHDGLPIARTASGTLTLSEDEVGLRAWTPDGLDMMNPRVMEAVSVMRRGDADQMSFAFTVDTDGDGVRLEQWDDEYRYRKIHKVRLYDVSLVTYPANPATAAHLRTTTTTDGAAGPAGLPARLAAALIEAATL